jgi:DNA-binding NarL/FixJ family response regulator
MTLYRYDDDTGRYVPASAAEIISMACRLMAATRRRSGPLPTLSTAQIAELRAMAARGVSKKIIGDKFNIARATVYRLLKDL